MSDLNLFLVGVGATVVGMSVLVPLLFGVARLFGLYTIVE